MLAMMLPGGRTVRKFPDDVTADAICEIFVLSKHQDTDLQIHCLQVFLMYRSLVVQDRGTLKHVAIAVVAGCI